MATATKTRNQSFVQEWDLVPIAIIGFVTWIVSWVLWNWRETVMDFTRFITPPEPFAVLGNRVPFIGSTSFTDLFFVAVALFALYVVMSDRWKNKQQSNILRIVTHFVGAMIAFRLFWDIWHWLHLNSQWYGETIFFSGKVAITFLLLSLACTPLITLFGWSSLNALKKPLGNWGFGFVLVHLALFTLDSGYIGDSFSYGAVIEATFQKQYALVGFIGFVLLLPLFVTSNKYSQKLLKKNWKRLHQLAYVVGVLAAVHYIWVWLAKLALTEPIIYAVVLALLLILRLNPVKEKIRSFKKNRQTARKAVATA